MFSCTSLFIGRRDGKFNILALILLLHQLYLKNPILCSSSWHYLTEQILILSTFVADSCYCDLTIPLNFVKSFLPFWCRNLLSWSYLGLVISLKFIPTQNTVLITIQSFYLSSFWCSPNLLFEATDSLPLHCSLHFISFFQGFIYFPITYG